MLQLIRRENIKSSKKIILINLPIPKLIAIFQQAISIAYAAFMCRTKY